MADYYTLLTNAGIAYETACKAAGTPIKLTQMSVGDGGAGGVYNPDATATALKREVWRGNLNALFQDPANPSWLLAEVTIPPEVGGWYVREAGLWTDTGVLYAVVKYPESFKPVLASSGSGKEFYIRSIFETSNAALVTLSIDDTIVKATRSWVVSYVADELAKLDRKQSVRAATTANIVLVGPQTIDGVAVVAGDRVLVKNQTAAKDNGVYVAAVGAWTRAKDADNSAKVTPNLTVAVEVGGTQADTIWQLVTDGLIVVGTTPLTFKDITDGFARLFSPSFAGNPTAPTPAQFDASKSIATAEYVKRSGVEFSGFTTNAESLALTAAHVGGLHSFASAAQVQATLPPTAGVAQAATITLVCAGSGGLKVVAAGGDVVYTSTGSAAPIVLALGDTAEFIRLENQWRLIGGTAALAFAGVMAGPNFATRPQFDAGKALATTEFVQRAQGNFSGQTNINASGTVIAPAMAGRRIVVSVPATLTLSQWAINTAGSKFYIQNSSNGDVVVNRWGTDSIVALAKTLTSITIPSGSFAVISCGEITWVLEEGVAALKYSNEFGFSHAVNGYQKLPSGLIEQWGSVAVTDNAEVNVVLPTAFPNAIFGALASVPLSAQAGAAEFSIAGVRKNGSSLNSILVNANSGPTTSVNPVIFWRVWGN